MSAVEDAERYPNNAEVRAWAQSKRAGAGLSDTGSLPRVVILAWNKAHPDRPYVWSQSQHGTSYGYKRGCRCRRCTDAVSAYNTNHRAAGGAGRWDS